MKRRLKVDLADLAVAFEGSRTERSYYLNPESGEVILVTDEMTSISEEVSEAAERESVEFDEALAASGHPDWMKEAAAQVADVEQRFGETIIDVPQDESRDAFRDMEEFAESLSNAGIRELLLRALSGGCPFRRFKDAIAAYPQEEQRWFAFRDQRLRRRVLDWLEEAGIEPID